MKHFQFALNSLWNRVHNWCFILSHCDVWYPEGLDCTRTQLDNPSSAQPIRAPPKTHFPTKMKLFTLATLYPDFELDGKWANRFSSLKYILDSRTIFWLFFRSFLNLHPPAVRSLANTGFARKKNLFAFVRRKNSPRPLYIATFSPTYPNYRKDILRSKQTGCISNPWH